MRKRTPPFSPEVRERAVRMVLDHQGEHGSQHAAIRSIAAKVDCLGETLRNWVRQAERDLCRVLPIAPSTYHAHAARRANPGKLPARARSDTSLRVEIRRVFEANFHVYGVRKVWRQFGREGIVVAWCTVARLIQALGLQGAVRGGKVRTTIPDPAAACPLDRVRRQFKAPRPDALWVSDFTYVATWAGFVYVAFVIDAFARRIVGWRAARTAQAGFVLDALEQALHERRPVRGAGLVHHSDRGVQYVSIRYTERLAEAGIEPCVGDSYDNALAETVNGLFKAEVIHPLSQQGTLDGGQEGELRALAA